jgi:hypothetical protein
MAKAPAPAKPAAPKQGGTTGATLMQQYEAAINRGVGQGTSGNPLGDFQQGAQAFWDSSANLRAYGDRLRKDTRGHEKSMLGMELGGQQKVARMGANNERYLAELGLQGTKYQTDGRVREAGIGAKAQIDVAGLQTGAQRYVADVGLKSDLAGFASSERIAGGVQAGENFRTGLNLAGSLLMNQADNFTQRQGQLYDYTARVAGTQWKAPDVNNIRYWG